MSLEQAILDRLEKRNEENARLQNIINDLERSAYASSKQERETYDALVAYIQKMRAQIESDRLEREQMQHQITELRSEHDRILEISKSLVPKSALKQAVMEAAGLSSEVAKLRAEVPLESTREALKNAVAKLQEATTDRDRLRNELAAIYAEANKSGYCNGDPVAQIKKGQHDADMVVSLRAQLQAATTRADNVATCRDRWMKIAADSGRMDGEDVGEFIARLAQQSAQGVELAVKVEELRVASIEREAALERLKDSDDRNTRTIANLSVELSARYAEIAELHKWATGLIENQSFARNAPERTMHYREIVERINGRPRLDLTATLPVIDWQAICIKREDEIARLNAKLGPLEALYKTLKGYHDSDKIIGHGSIIKVAIDVATEALSQLTA